MNYENKTETKSPYPLKQKPKALINIEFATHKNYFILKIKKPQPS